MNKLVLKKECITSESHNRELSAFCIGFYGIQNSLIISKIRHIGTILPLRFDETVCCESLERSY